MKYTYVEEYGGGVPTSSVKTHAHVSIFHYSVQAVPSLIVDYLWNGLDNADDSSSVRSTCGGSPGI